MALVPMSAWRRRGAKAFAGFAIPATAVTTEMRSQALPDVPTLGEFLPSFEASGW
jgi:hypothetical protein